MVCPEDGSNTFLSAYKTTRYSDLKGKNTNIQIVRMLPSSGIYRRVVRMLTDVSEERIRPYLMNTGFLLGCFSTLKMEVICSSETSLHTQTTRRYIPEDGNVHNYRCENLNTS
jgi:hypothetical protein